MDNNTLNSLNQSSAQITNAASVIQASADSRKGREFAKEMYERALTDQRQDILNARAYNEELYNKYQSPAALMQQYKNAGINPNSAAESFGSSNASPAVQGAISAPSASSPSFSPVSSSLSNAAVAQLTIAKQQAEIENLKANTQGIDIENKYKDEQQRLSIDQARSLIAKNDAEIKQYLSSVNLNDAQTKQVYEILPYLAQKSEVELEQMRASVAKFVEEKKRIEHEIGLLDEQVQTERHKQRNLDASSELLTGQANTEVQNEKIAYYEAAIRQKKEELTRASSAYEKDMYEHGLDPSKISYDLNNPTGIAIGAIQMVKYKKDHK